MTKVTGMSAKDKKKMREPILKDIKKLMSKYGVEETAYTLRWYLSIESGKQQRERKIEKLKEEIEQIKKGKSPDYM